MWIVVWENSRCAVHSTEADALETVRNLIDHNSISMEDISVFETCAVHHPKIVFSHD